MTAGNARKSQSGVGAEELTEGRGELPEEEVGIHGDSDLRRGLACQGKPLPSACPAVPGRVASSR